MLNLKLNSQEQKTMTTQKRKVTAKVTNTTNSVPTEEKVKPTPRTRASRAKAKPVSSVCQH